MVTTPIQVSKSDFEREDLADECPDVSYLEQDGFEDRLAACRRGDFSFMGIRARVNVLIPHGDGFITQRIQSPGLWGIETDSDSEYLDSVFADECAILSDILTAMGMEVVA